MDLCQNPTGGRQRKHLVQMSTCRSTSVSKALSSLEVYFHMEKSHQQDKEPGAALHCGLFPAGYEQ